MIYMQWRPLAATLVEHYAGWQLNNSVWKTYNILEKRTSGHSGWPFTLVFYCYVYRVCLKHIQQEFLTGNIPFQHINSEMAAMFAIIKYKLPHSSANLSLYSDVESSLWKMCKTCWCKVPTQRPSIERLRETIQKLIDYSLDSMVPVKSFRMHILVV